MCGAACSRVVTPAAVRCRLQPCGHTCSRAVPQASSDDSVRLSLLYWTDEMSDPNSAIGKAVTAAAPGLAGVCRRCWPKSCSWMDCWSEEHSLESW